MDNKINELLNKLTLIPVNEWITIGNGYSVILNGITINIQGESEFGWRYYIKLDNELIYKYEEPRFNLKKPEINKRLDAICGNIDLYLYKMHELKSISKIETVVA